jgi:prepilin signal peptidase PulO-like enzyme (type II secretory pathway)
MEAILVVVIGAICGVIINYFADVLPIYRKPGPPICPNCAKRFTAYNYLISFQCKNCGQRVSAQTILVHIYSITAALLFWIYPYQNFSFWWTIPVIIFLGIILVIDIEYRVVLIQTSFFGLVLMFVLGLINQGFSLQGLIITLLGGVAGFLIMIGFYYLGILFSRIMSRIRHQEIEEVALGFGDVYVSAMLGLLIGWPAIISAIILAIVISGVFSFLFLITLTILKKYKSFSAIPYTPFLIVGALILPYLLK